MPPQTFTFFGQIKDRTVRSLLIYRKSAGSPQAIVTFFAQACFSDQFISSSHIVDSLISLTNAVLGERCSSLYKRIAIIGGGPDGLTLALILQRNGISSVIYECELEDRAVLYDEFQHEARYEGEDFNLFDKTGKVYMNVVVDEEVPGGNGRPEIDRGVSMRSAIEQD